MGSHSSRVAIVALAIIGCFGTEKTWANKARKLPLVVERATASKDFRLGDGSPIDLNIDLVNSGTKTATGWAYWIDLVLDNGTTRRIYGSTDALPATEPENYVLHSKARRIDTHQLPDVRPAAILDVSVRLGAVIFDDATAEGDEKLLDVLFARRSDYRETWIALSAILKRARAHTPIPQ